MKKVIEQEGKDAIRIEEGLVFDGIKISQHMRGVIYIDKSKAREVALAICPELGEPTIKSVTNCVTCGSECDVNTDGTTHYYISKTEHFKSELKKAVELIKLFHSLPDLLHDSLGDHTAGNDYEITSLSGERYITHKWVGSGEPLKQWIKSEINKALK